MNATPPQKKYLAQYRYHGNDEKGGIRDTIERVSKSKTNHLVKAGSAYSITLGAFITFMVSPVMGPAAIVITPISISVAAAAAAAAGTQYAKAYRLKNSQIKLENLIYGREEITPQHRVLSLPHREDGKLKFTRIHEFPKIEAIERATNDEIRLAEEIVSKAIEESKLKGKHELLCKSKLADLHSAALEGLKGTNGSISDKTKDKLTTKTIHAIDKSGQKGFHIGGRNIRLGGIKKAGHQHLSSKKVGNLSTKFRDIIEKERQKQKGPDGLMEVLL